MNPKGKVAIVSGGGVRVGRHISIALARRKVNLVITYRSSKREAMETARAVRRFGVKCKTVQMDLAQSAGFDDIVKNVHDEFGRIDILVNNAAVYFKASILTATRKDWDVTLDSNLKGPFFLTQSVAGVMLKHGGGKIINIADWAAIRPYPDYLPYCISKAGIIAMTKALARGLAPKIQVNAVAPGPVLLPEAWGRNIRNSIIKATPLKKIGLPDDIANAVLFLIEGSDFITGAILPVDGGRLIA